MDAVEFVKARRRMLKQTCRTIDLYNDYINPEDVVAETEKWAKEHPAKTRQSEFLKIYPDATIDINTGTIIICPATLSNSHKDKDGVCNQLGVWCSDCQREFWLEEIK